MATVTYSGTGVVASTDFKTVKWIGKTKNGNSVSIELSDAICMSNVDWSFVDKDDTVAEVEFTATYSNTDAVSSSAAEPFKVKFTSGGTATGDIMLGAGVLQIGSTQVALTRGGGSFTVEREYREINADGDRGPVKERIVLDRSVAKLKMNVLSIISNFSDLYPAMTSEATA